MPLLAGAAVLVMALALALGLMSAVPGAIALLACELVVSLAALHVEATLTAAIYGAALFVVAELACLSIQLRVPSRAAPGFFQRHALVTAAVALAVLGIGASAATLSRAPVAGSVPLLAAGIGAVVVTIGIVAAVLWRSQAGQTSGMNRR